MHDDVSQVMGERPPQPISAGLLAQVMVGFLNMYQASGHQGYLDQANVLARYAMVHYWRDGWFVCGPPTVPRYRDDEVDVRRTYSNRGGSAELALILLRLHLVATGADDFVADNPFAYF